MRRVASFAVGFLLLALMPAVALGDMSHYPTTSNLWTKRDYLAFYFAHFNGNRALPHLRSIEQRRLFGRIVDDANLRAIIDSSEPPEAKGRHLAMILGTMGEIRAAYDYAVLVGEPLQEELAQIQIFMLDVMSAMGDLPYADADGQRRQSWQTMIFGILGALSERRTFSKQQILRLSRAFEASYENVSHLMDQRARTKLGVEVASLAMTETDQDIRTALNRLQRVMAP